MDKKATVKIGSCNITFKQTEQILQTERKRIEKILERLEGFMLRYEFGNQNFLRLSTMIIFETFFGISCQESLVPCLQLNLYQRNKNSGLFMLIHYLHKSHNTVHLEGLFASKQRISCSLKHDTVLRVNNLYCFYLKNPPKQIALWYCASCECLF